MIAGSIQTLVLIGVSAERPSVIAEGCRRLFAIPEDSGF